jgi:hypothetical protein
MTRSKRHHLQKATLSKNTQPKAIPNENAILLFFL